MKWFAPLLVFLVFSCNKGLENNFTFIEGGLVRGDTTQQSIALIFTGHEYAEGADTIINILENQNVKASFFFTGDFYRNENFTPIIEQLLEQNHYLGAHSNKHLLYCDWSKRDSLLVSKSTFMDDLKRNYREMEKFSISKGDAEYFMPPYEWYNHTISEWTEDLDLTLVNFTSGTRSNADYTTPSMKNYISSDKIYRSIIDYELRSQSGLNGFLLLIHLGTHPDRTDKFYYKLDDLITSLKNKGYQFQTVEELLN